MSGHKIEHEQIGAQMGLSVGEALQPFWSPDGERVDRGRRALVLGGPVVGAAAMAVGIWGSGRAVYAGTEQQGQNFSINKDGVPPQDKVKEEILRLDKRMNELMGVRVDQYDERPEVEPELAEVVIEHRVRVLEVRGVKVTPRQVETVEGYIKALQGVKGKDKVTAYPSPGSAVNYRYG